MLSGKERTSKGRALGNDVLVRAPNFCGRWHTGLVGMAVACGVRRFAAFMLRGLQRLY